jgi:hypothetical protein
VISRLDIGARDLSDGLAREDGQVELTRISFLPLRIGIQHEGSTAWAASSITTTSKLWRSSTRPPALPGRSDVSPLASIADERLGMHAPMSRGKDDFGLAQHLLDDAPLSLSVILPQLPHLVPFRLPRRPLQALLPDAVPESRFKGFELGFDVSDELARVGAGRLRIKRVGRERGEHARGVAQSRQGDRVGIVGMRDREALKDVVDWRWVWVAGGQSVRDGGRGRVTDRRGWIRLRRERAGLARRVVG